MDHACDGVSRRMVGVVGVGILTCYSHHTDFDSRVHQLHRGYIGHNLHRVCIRIVGDRMRIVLPTAEDLVAYLPVLDPVTLCHVRVGHPRGRLCCGSAAIVGCYKRLCIEAGDYSGEVVKVGCPGSRVADRGIGLPIISI